MKFLNEKNVYYTLEMEGFGILMSPLGELSV